LARCGYEACLRNEEMTISDDVSGKQFESSEMVGINYDCLKDPLAWLDLCFEWSKVTAEIMHSVLTDIVSVGSEIASKWRKATR